MHDPLEHVSTDHLIILKAMAQRNGHHEALKRSRPPSGDSPPANLPALHAGSGDDVQPEPRGQAGLWPARQAEANANSCGSAPPSCASFRRLANGPQDALRSGQNARHPLKSHSLLPLTAIAYRARFPHTCSWLVSTRRSGSLSFLCDPD